MSRRSFFGGRPEPLGRKKKGWKLGSRFFSNSEGEVWSSAYSLALAALTLRSSNCNTLNCRTRLSLRTTMTSWQRTQRDGLAACPAIVTRPW